MSAQIVELGDNISQDAPKHPKAPDPVTRNLNHNQTTEMIAANMRVGEEYIHGFVKESTVWDVYNNEARKVDNELVKDWTASLNFLLVFAAIFAAVLTAFIIESKKMLEPDQTEILVDITIQYFNSIGNPSRTNLTRPDFEPTSTAISINCCLFASLGASLVAALASVVSLQWVADYDAAITRGGSSPEDRAKRRQFRHAGVVGWKMGEIIAALPLLLYSSVILFWAGAIQWMWDLNHIVGYVVAGGTGIAVLFYASTTLLGAIYVSSPFRTPLSRGLYWLPRWSLSILGRVLLRLGPDKFINRFTSLSRGLRNTLSPEDIPFTSLYRVSPHSTPSEGAPASEAVSKWVKIHLLVEDTARHREDESAKLDPAFQQDALAWLADQLPISADSHNRLILFANGMLALPRETPLSRRFIEAPWLAILESLSTHYIQRIIDPSTSVEDCEGLDVLLHLIDHPYIRTRVVPGPNYERDSTTWEYWRQYPGRSNSFGRPHPNDLASMTFILTRDVPVPLLGSKYELDATFKLIRWRNSPGGSRPTPGDTIWSEIFGNIQHYSPGFFKSSLYLFQKFLNIRLLYRARLPEVVHTIAMQALSRTLTIEEAVALSRVFALAMIPDSVSFQAGNRDLPILKPLRYGAALASESQEIQELHNTITFLVARVVAESVPRDERALWVKWIVTMLWIGGPKEPGYWKETTVIADQRGITSLWGKVDMTLGALPLESPRIKELVGLLTALVKPLSGDEPLWINSKTNDGKLGQTMRLLAAFDTLMAPESGQDWHSTLVRLVCNDMCGAGIQWPSAVKNQETHIDSPNTLKDHRQQLTHIRDPCLALMGAFANGMPRPDMLVRSKMHLVQNHGCLERLRCLAFKEFSVNDPSALWEIRAAMGTVSPFFIRSYFTNIMYEPEHLTCLELLLQHPTQCHSHITGPQHLLLHLCDDPIGWIHGAEMRVGYLNFDWEGQAFDLILAMLALPGNQNLSDIRFSNGKPDSAERIWEICRVVKDQPRDYFCLLVDIVTERVAWNCRLADIVLILESVKQASALPADETFTSLLRSLEMGLPKLLGRVARFSTTKEQLEMVTNETNRICCVLQARSSRNLISTNAHLRMLSCAQSVTVAPPAIGWLRMHVDL